MSNKAYIIDRIREGSINLADRVKTEVVGSYQDAVDAAHEIFRGMPVKTNVFVYSKAYRLFHLHAIYADGRVSDRNTNSGVKHPENYSIRYQQGRGYVSAE